jgi:predicted transcriptional regulator
LREYHPRKKDQRLRLLDFDDLIILRYLLRDVGVRKIAKLMCVTQPCVSNRIRKMRFVFDGDIIKTQHKFSYLTKTGIEAAIKADILLDILTGK